MAARILCFAFSLVVSVALIAGPAAANESDVAPGTMRGVKFKHPGGQNDHAGWANNCRYQTGAGDRSYRSVLKHLHRNEIHHLFVKFPQPSQIPKKCRDDSILETHIVKVLRAMSEFNADLAASDTPMRAWVWERDWFMDDRDGGHNARGYDDFVDDMSDVIKRARRADVAGPLEGIAPIEVNLPGSEKVREYALRLARDINARTNDWLEDHTLLFPGAGMGSWFKNIGDTGAIKFLDNMKREVNYFSFIYKFMKSQDKAGDRHVNKKLYEYYYGPTADWQKELAGDRTLEQQRTYIESTLGFGDLAALIKEARTRGYDRLAHVVFWGDSGDGLLQMNRTNVQLMHELLVEELDESGYFFDFAIIGANESDKKERSKHVLLDLEDSVTQNEMEPFRNRGPDVTTVWDEWRLWRNPGTNY